VHVINRHNASLFIAYLDGMTQLHGGNLHPGELGTLTALLTTCTCGSSRYECWTCSSSCTGTAELAGNHPSVSVGTMQQR
jgi:hypothetical protein